MDINLKVKRSTFEKIITGQIDHIRHGFSHNKKYSRLFENQIEKIILTCDETGRVVEKKFKSISTIILNDKKHIQINFI